MRTATVFSLALFPQMFLFERVLHSDVIFVLTDRNLDDKNHVNRCVLRTTTGSFRNLTIPLDPPPVPPGDPADEARVQAKQEWLPRLPSEVRRCYLGLRYAGRAEEVVRAALHNVDSPWLTDYLMSALLASIQALGWGKKEIVRGDSAERRCYLTDSSYLLEMCLEHNCDRLIVGRGQQNLMNQKLFRRNEIDLSIQLWEGPKSLPSRDSILDALARLTPEEIADRLQAPVTNE